MDITPLTLIVLIEILALISVIGLAFQLAHVIPTIKKREKITKKRIVKTLFYFVGSAVLICLITLG
jgi:hypothetical protein